MGWGWIGVEDEGEGERRRPTSSGGDFTRGPSLPLTDHDALSQHKSTKANSGCLSVLPAEIAKKQQQQREKDGRTRPPLAWAEACLSLCPLFPLSNLTAIISCGHFDPTEPHTHLLSSPLP